MLGRVSRREEVVQKGVRFRAKLVIWQRTSQIMCGKVRLRRRRRVQSSTTRHAAIPHRIGGYDSGTSMYSSTTV